LPAIRPQSTRHPPPLPPVAAPGWQLGYSPGAATTGIGRTSQVRCRSRRLSRWRDRRFMARRLTDGLRIAATGRARLAASPAGSASRCDWILPLPFNQRREPMPKLVIERDIPGAGKFSRKQLQAISQKFCGVLRADVPADSEGAELRHRRQSVLFSNCAR
jgi:hypothetical protein